MTSKLNSDLLADLFPLTVGAEMPPQEKVKIEAKKIMRRALKDTDLLEEIKERACIRWEQGYSDSLYLAVLSGIIDTEEQREYTDEPDIKQADFLRSSGFNDADIMNREKCPSVWIKRQPHTDWNAELREYM